MFCAWPDGLRLSTMMLKAALITQKEQDSRLDDLNIKEYC